MSVAVNLQNPGNVGTIRVRYETLKEVDNGKGAKIKKWVADTNSTPIPPHAAHDFYVGANSRRAIIEEQPT